MADISYPRRRLIRSILRTLGRLIIPLLARVDIDGLGRFPQEGPIIVVGNHSGAMEVVLMTIYSPRMVEYLGSVDIPHEPYIAALIHAYGFIPVWRGNVSRQALESALGVLREGGVLGIFPEGGIWEPAIQRAQAGVAWISHRAAAPILPIGFGNMRGALNAMLRLQRPTLTMHVGDVMPPVQIQAGESRKEQLSRSAGEVVAAIWDLVPEKPELECPGIVGEEFEFTYGARNRQESEVPIPSDLKLEHSAALSKFIHRPVLFANLAENLGLPIRALRTLAEDPPLVEIIQATGAILNYLSEENPYYFTYRYGQAEGSSMEKGIRELDRLARWAVEKGYRLQLLALRRVRYSDSAQEVVLDRPASSSRKW